MTQRRSDADRNRASILSAADVVFARHGVGAPLDMVIKEAGVGRATFYRNFGDRTALVIALLDREIDQLEEQARELSDADGALYTLLCFGGEHITHRGALFDHLLTIPHDLPQIVQAQTRLRALFEPALNASVAVGGCRDDLTLDDVVLVSSMIGGAMHGRGVRDRKDVSDRAISLIFEGLKPRSKAVR